MRLYNLTARAAFGPWPSPSELGAKLAEFADRHRNAIGLVLCTFGAALISNDALAAGFAGQQAGWGTQAGAIANGLGMASYTAGAGSFYGAVGKFKEFSKDPDRNPVQTPVLLTAAAAAFVALPMYAGIGVGSIFGDGASMTDTTGGGMTAIKPK